LARMAQFHCPYYRPPLVDEAPPTEVGAVAGGGCAARELVGGSQPYGILFHLGLPSAADLLLRRACPGPREDIAPHLCWSGRNGPVTRSRPTCSKSGANKIWVLPIHMDICSHVDVLPRGLGWCHSNRFDSGEPWLGQLWPKLNEQIPHLLPETPETQIVRIFDTTQWL
jgi:hypothetical protein